MGDEDISGIHSDLHALRKLYSLLQTKGHGLQDESSTLDEKSRLLLKNLLDDAAARVLDAHSEIITTQLGNTSDHRPSNLTNMSRQISHSVLQSTKTGLNAEKVALHNNDKRKMTTIIPSMTQPLTKRQQSPPCLDKSTPSFSSCTSENRRKKRCRFCRQSSVKQLKSTESTLPYNESQILSKHQLYNIPTTFCLGTGGPNKELGFADKVNHERNLESQKQSRRSLSEFKRNPLKNVAADAEFTGVKHNFTDQEASNTIELIESCIVALQKVVSLAKQVEPQEKKNLSPTIGSNLRANSSTNVESKEIKSLFSPLNHSMKKDMPNESVAGQNVKAILEKMESLRLAVSQKGYNMPGQQTIKKMITSQPSISSPVSYIHHHKADQSLGFNQKKSKRRLILSESDGTSSSLEYSSSCSTSQQDVSFSSSISSRGSSVNTGDTQSEYYRSFSSGSEDMGPTSSCDSLPSGDDSLASKYNHDGTAYRKSKWIGLKKNGDLAKPEKRIGRLRKLKDKLAIIFHHHHHHHHHHDDSKNKEACKEKKAVKKVVRKSVVEKEGHFRGLVDGLLDHLKHDKKSKVGVKKLDKRQNGVVKKLHWWQMLRRQRRGAKGQNKKLPKLGYGTRS